MLQKLCVSVQRVYGIVIIICSPTVYLFFSHIIVLQHCFRICIMPYVRYRAVRIVHAYTVQ